MPVYNGEKYLKEAIDSILNQTYGDFEFIILNDGSTDRTEEIILSYDDPRIVYVKNEENLQIVKTLNKGIDLAKGKYIARMDADDISLPERFKKQVNYLENNKNIDICGTFIKHFGAKSRIQEYPIFNEDIKVNLLFNAALAHPTVMVKKSCFLKNKYDDLYNQAEDYALWVNMIGEYRFMNIPEVLLLYRNHQKQTDKNKQMANANEVRKVVLESYGEEIDDEDIWVLNQIATYRYVPVRKVEKLYFKLIEMNKQKYDTLLLKKELVRRYRWMIDAHTYRGIGFFLDFFNSPIKKLAPISLKYQFKFFIKCLVRYNSEKK